MGFCGRREINDGKENTQRMPWQQLRELQGVKNECFKFI